MLSRVERPRPRLGLWPVAAGNIGNLLVCRPSSATRASRSAPISASRSSAERRRSSPRG